MGGSPPWRRAAGGDPNAVSDSWQRELKNNYYLRIEIGKPVESIRAITYENASDDAAFAQQILNGLDEIDATRLDHDRWLTYRTLRYLAGNDVAAKKYYWLTQQATPYAGGSQIAEIATVFASCSVRRLR